MGKNCMIPKDILPPSAPEIEAAILGALLLNGEAITRVDMLKQDMFYLKENSIIFNVMTEMFKDNIPIDTLTLHVELKKRGKLEEIGGSNYLTELKENIVSSANIEYHAKIIYEKYLLRGLIKSGNKIITLANEDEDSIDIIENAEKEIFDLTQVNFKKYTSIKDATLKLLERLESGKVESVKTGFPDLDNILDMGKGELIIIAARPSIGKTGLAIKILKNIAAKHPCGLFSLEMNNDAIVTRNLSLETGLRYREITSGKYTEEQAETIHKGFMKVSDLKLFVDDTPSISITEFKSKARRMKIEQGIKLIVVDYLQLMRAKAENREREISMISQGLKNVAKDLNIPVIALSQLNRAVEARSDKKPNLSDLRESGAIEQDADAVLFIYRPEYYDISQTPDGFNSKDRAIIIISKQRNGATGEITLGFKKETAEFYNLADAKL